MRMCVDGVLYLRRVNLLRVARVTRYDLIEGRKKNQHNLWPNNVEAFDTTTHLSDRSHSLIDSFKI